MAEIILREDYFLGLEELKIFYRFYQIEGIPLSTPTVVMAHGLGEHGGRYGEPLHTFLDLKIPVVILDHRGHGRSAGQRGHVRSFSHYVGDLKLLMEKLELYKPILFGHSMGALISIRFAQMHPQYLRALILSSPLMGVKMKVPAWKTSLGKVASKLIPRLSLPSELDPQNLSRDPAVVQAYIEDPFVHGMVSARWFTEMQKAQQLAFHEVSRLDLPILLQLSGSDRICDPKESEHFFGQIPFSQKEMKVYPSFYHETFHEPEKEQALQDLKKWLKEKNILSL